MITNTTTKQNDAWGAYPTEWNALKNFILANNILNVVFISGDLHLNAIDNGVQSGFPEMCVAAANQTKNTSCATDRNGTWSEGYYDETCAGFGLVSILRNPDRLVLEAADEFGIIHLAYTVADQMASRPTKIDPQLLWLQAHPAHWNHWWSKTALSKVRVNPGSPSCAPPTN